MADPIQYNDPNMQSRMAQTGGGGGPSSMATVSKAVEQLPANLLGLMNSMSLRPKETAMQVVVEPLANKAAEMGSRAKGGLISGVLKALSYLFPKIRL